MSDVASLFMKLTGKKPNAFLGESESEGYVGQIEIDDWNWSLARPPEPDSAKGADKPSVLASNASVPSVLSFGKLMCKATANMLQAMVTGELLTAVISLEEDSDIDFELIVTLEGVRIIDYGMVLTAGDTGGKIDETWTFDYQKVSFDYMSSGSGGRVSMKPPLMRPAGASKEKNSVGTEALMQEAATKIVDDLKGTVNVGELATRWRDILEAAEKAYKPGRVKEKKPG